MKLTDKYLLREYLVPVTYCLAAFCMIQVVCDLFGQLSKFLDADASLRLVLLYYTLHLASTLEYLMPASLMLATLYTLWQMSRHNELTALRASGVGLHRIMIPFITIGILFSVINTVIKESVAPEAYRWTTELRDRDFAAEARQDDIKQIHYMDARFSHEWQVNRFNPQKPHRLRDVTIKVRREDGSTARRIVAAGAGSLDGQWWLFDGEIEECNQDDFVTNRIDLPALGLEFCELKAKPFDFLVAQWQEDLLPVYLSSWQLLNHVRSLPQSQEDRIDRLYADFHSRLAIPWACLVGVLVAIPVGIRTARQNALITFFLALGLFVVFFVLHLLGVFLAKIGVVWPWLGAWFSNILFLSSGSVMLLRMR